MSADEETINRREVAYRLFASEFEDSDFSYAESDEDRAPNYVITPTGARVNRLFVVGVLTEVQPVSDDVLRARVVDPTGAFVIYAGQYQPDAQAFLERAEPPAFVAVSGKARTFQPEDSDVVYTSIRPESINQVDAETRDRWTVRTAERTLDRIGTMAGALRSDATGERLRERLADQGVPDGLAAGIPLSIDHYGTGGPYLDALRATALEALGVVAGEREEVADRSVSPDAPGEADLARLADIELSSPAATEEPPEPATATADSRAGTATAGSDASETEPETAADAPDESETDVPGDAIDGVESSEVQPSETHSSETPGEIEQPATPEETDEPTGSGSSTDSAGTETPETERTAAGSPAGDESADTSAEDDELGDFEPGEFDLDEEVREEVRSEYGTEFQSGTEVDEPGQADIETPDAEGLDQGEPAEETAPADVDETETADDAEPSGEIDLEDAVMDAMTDLDDGNGASREHVVDTVVDEHGADPVDVEDAIQNALMNGRCYEPDDETLKSI